MRLLLALALLAGCRASQVQNCGDGFLCPAGQVCAPGRDLCVAPEQLTACQGMADGAMCSVAGATTAACMQGVCIATSSGGGNCGNGMLDSGETCDGAPPAGQSCLDYGFDAGKLGCSMSCGPDLSGCRHIGWTAMKLPAQGAVDLVRGSAANDVWAIYGVGGVLHYDGSTWKDVALPNGSQSVSSLWDNGPNDVWALINGAPRHWDGSSWAAAPSIPIPILLPPVGATSVPIWGSAHDVYFAIGDALLHSDGTSATVVLDVPMATWRSIWGSGPSDVFAVGTGGLVAHFDGTSWSDSMVDSFQAVWGSGPKDVWAAGQNGIQRYDGKWTTSTSGKFLDVWGNGPGDVFAVEDIGSSGMPVTVLTHFDGARWTQLPLVASTTLRSFWSSGPHDLFAAGDFGIVYGQGSSWSPGPTMQPQLAALWSPSPDEVWGAGPSGISHFQNGIPSAPPPLLGPFDATGVWGVSDTDVWAVGCMGSSCSAAPGGPAPPMGVVMHLSGSSSMWTMEPVPLTEPALGIWGSGPADIYVTSPEGIYHYDGSSWSQSLQGNASASPTGPIWGSSASDVWAAALGKVLHFDGTGWLAPLTLNANSLVNAIWGRGPNDVWFAGTGQVAHWDGTAITTTELAGYDLHAIWGSAPDDLFVGGIAGTLLHFDGTDWLPVRLPMMGNVAAIAGASAGEVWIGGTFGVVELFRTALPSP